MVSDRFYATVRALSLPFLKAWIRLHVHGLENLPAQGALLMVANHTSYLDPAVLGRASPRKVHFFIKRSVWRQRGMTWFFRGMDSIPTSGDPADTSGLRVGLRHLAGCQSVGSRQRNAICCFVMQALTNIDVACVLRGVIRC